MTATLKSPGRRVVRTLHFTVDFAGLTARARDFWAERKYGHAMRMLVDGCNLSEEQSQHVLFGTKRMAQHPTGRKGCEGTLLPDAWSPAKEYGSGVFYPDPRLGLAYAEAACARCIAETENVRLRQDVAAMAETISELADEPEARRPRNLLVDQFMAREKELEKRPTPKPDRTFVANCAWILPNGNFYPLRSIMEHIWLADRLGKTEREAEDAGWVKISTGMFGINVVSCKPPTQKQINTVFDWANAAKDGTKASREMRAQEWLRQWKDL